MSENSHKIPISIIRILEYTYFIVGRNFLSPNELRACWDWITRQRESRSVTPLSFCLRVIVNEKPVNLERTTSTLLTVIKLSNIWSVCTSQLKLNPHEQKKIQKQVERWKDTEQFSNHLYLHFHTENLVSSYWKFR